MQKSLRIHDSGVGKAGTFLIVVLLLAIAGLALKITNREAPSVNMQREIKGIGVSTPLELNVHDSNYRIKSVQVEVRQGDQSIPSSGRKQQLGGSRSEVVEALVAARREQRHIHGEGGAQGDSQPEGRFRHADRYGEEQFVGAILPRRTEPGSSRTCPFAFLHPPPKS